LIIALGFWLGLSWALETAPALGQENVESYTVAAGDTLFVIAQRFGVSIEAITLLNNINDPNLLRVGQVLLIPAAGANLNAVPTHLIQAEPGDTLQAIGQRYSLDVNTLASLNSISAAARLFPGQAVRLPAGQASRPLVPPLRFGAIQRIVAPSQLVQGRTGRLLVQSSRPLALRAEWNGLPLSFMALSLTSTQQIAFLPVPALLGPGAFTLTVAYTAANGLPLTHQQLIPVVDGGYERQSIDLPPDRAALLDPALVTAEAQKVIAVWSQLTPMLYWSGPFSRPITNQYETTSPFGQRRSYNGGPFSDYHAGQDFGAPAGVAVTAPANAFVALAEPLTVRGNAVLLDHGGGVYTGYWHLSELRVAPGQHVAAGDLIGLVGNTGLSTGAHLHWEMRIYGVAVNPMQFLEEPLVSIPP
jgi:murein DD-endopeptidase MepM/ murein hydrolase activator NlpD